MNLCRCGEKLSAFTLFWWFLYYEFHNHYWVSITGNSWKLYCKIILHCLHFRSVNAERSTYNVALELCLNNMTNRVELRRIRISWFHFQWNHDIMGMEWSLQYHNLSFFFISLGQSLGNWYSIWILYILFLMVLNELFIARVLTLPLLHSLLCLYIAEASTHLILLRFRSLILNFVEHFLLLIVLFSLTALILR